MTERKCGVCNKELSLSDEQVTRCEGNGQTTIYHMRCEPEARRLKPCEDCGLHRKICNECKE
jgi:hypothetical protein